MNHYINGLRLSERALIKKEISGNNRDADQKIAKYIEKAFFGEKELFDLKLDALNLSSQEFGDIVFWDESAPEPVGEKDPLWFSQIEKLIDAYCLEDYYKPFESKRYFMLCAPVLPLILWGLSRLKRDFKNHTDAEGSIPLQDEVYRNFFSHVDNFILSAVFRTSVMEMKILAIEQEWGDISSEGRLKRYFQYYSDKEHTQSFFSDNICLFRSIYTLINNWVIFCNKVLASVNHDRDVLINVFGIQPSDSIANIRFQSGDYHNNNQSVAVLEFASQRKVVYKPRSLASDMEYSRFISLLNEGLKSDLKVPLMVSNADYGWCEYIEQAYCNTDEELKCFYVNMGHQLALLYLLNSIDMHSENLIACGQYPVLIDLETIFQPKIKNKRLMAYKSAKKINLLMGFSVLDIGLLPGKIWGDKKKRKGGVDISGIGMTADQEIDAPSLFLEEKDNEFYVEKRKTLVTKDKNLPFDDTQSVSITAYAPEVMKGFKAAYLFFLANRTLLSNTFSSITAERQRVLLRETETYSSILLESFHPDNLTNSVYRERHFDLLWNDTKLFDFLHQVTQEEIEALYNNDIPYFQSGFSNNSLFMPSGREIENFFEESGSEALENRLLSLSEADLQKQLWFIEASFTTLNEDIRLGQRLTYDIGVEGMEAVPNKDQQAVSLGTTISGIADRIALLADYSEDSVDWVGINFYQNECEIGPLKYDLYDGKLGLAFSFLYLYKYCSSEEKKAAYLKLLKGIRQDVLRQFSGERREKGMSVGGFDGLGGVVYGLTHMGVIMEDTELLNLAEKIHYRAEQQIVLDQNFDLYSGTAGYLLSLIGLYEVTNNANLLNGISTAVDHLLKQAKHLDGTIVWSDGMDVPLAGLGHGMSGIACALAKANTLLSKDTVNDYVLGALRYEDKLFDQETQTWVDLRSGPKIKNMTAWCNGSSGIGMARVKLLGWMHQNEVLTEKLKTDLNIACANTLKYGFGLNHSLCHGDVGNVQFLIDTVRAERGIVSTNTVDRIIHMINQYVSLSGSICGVPLGVETPGLMTGTSGVSYGLLRTLYPDTIPNVLLLDAPCTAKKKKYENSIAAISGSIFSE